MKIESTIQEDVVHLVFISDPGHGWACVPHSFIWELGIQDEVSVFSYLDEKYAYLEEDCDLSVLMRAIEKKGWTLQLEERYLDVESPIRNKIAYKATHYPQPNLVDVTVDGFFVVRDEEGVLRGAQDSFNWSVSATNARLEITQRIVEEIERQQQHGWLKGKSFKMFQIDSVVRNTENGLHQDFPVLVAAVEK